MADRMYQFGFIGMGNMGYAILKGLLGVYSPEKITFSARNQEKIQDIAARTDVKPSENNRACASSCKYLVLAVKPQQLDAVMEEIRDAVDESQIVISIAPGITMENLRKRFGKPCRCSARPNTPALVGEGMTGVSYDSEELSQEEIQVIHQFFQSFWPDNCGGGKTDGCCGLCQRKLSCLCIHVYGSAGRQCGKIRNSQSCSL